MSTLVSITDSNDSAARAAHRIHALPVVVIFPHNQCNCRCVMCDIWRIREAKEITPEDLERHLSSFRQLGVRWFVFSGGEPQLNENWGGPPVVHNSIRRIPGAFEQLAEGVKALHNLRPELQIGARCTVQKANHHA